MEAEGSKAPSRAYLACGCENRGPPYVDGVHKLITFDDLPEPPDSPTVTITPVTGDACVTPVTEDASVSLTTVTENTVTPTPETDNASGTEEASAPLTPGTANESATPTPGNASTTLTSTADTDNEPTKPTKSKGVVRKSRGYVMGESLHLRFPVPPQPASTSSMSGFTSSGSRRTRRWGRTRLTRRTNYTPISDAFGPPFARDLLKELREMKVDYHYRTPPISFVCFANAVESYLEAGGERDELVKHLMKILGAAKEVPNVDKYDVVSLTFPIFLRKMERPSELDDTRDVSCMTDRRGSASSSSSDDDSSEVEELSSLDSSDDSSDSTKERFRTSAYNPDD